MTQINVRPKEICIENYKVAGMIKKMEWAENAVRNVSYQTEADIAGRYGIFLRMRMVQNEIKQLKNRIDELCRVTDLCMRQYKKTESEINRNAKAFD